MATKTKIELPLDDALLRDVGLLCEKMGADMPTVISQYLIDLLHGPRPAIDYAARRETLRQYREGFISSDDALETLELDNIQALEQLTQAYGFSNHPKAANDTPANLAFAAFMKSRLSQT